jgi:heme oxygenase
MQPASVIAAPARFSARHLLREATADLHREIDERFSGPFGTDRTAYQAFLGALARAVLPLEAALEAGGVGALLPDWTARRRSPALAADISALGLDLPASAGLTEIRGEPLQFGTLYVLEGSRLGAKLLLRRVLGHPDPVVRGATHYLSHGADRDLWRPFVDRLEASDAVRDAPDQVIAGARSAFLAFRPEAAHA